MINIKVIYLIFLIIALVLLVIDLVNNKKKDRLSKSYSFLDRLKRLSKNKFFKLFQDKPQSKSYKKLKNDLIGAGIQISPEVFKTFSIIFTFFIVVCCILIKYLNIVNTIINFEQIKIAAERLNKPELLEISLQLNWISLLVIVLISYLIPYGVLKLIVLIRKGMSEKEVLKLQTYTIIMLKTQMPTKRILVCLHERADLFKEPLKIAVESFSTNPNKVLQDLKNSVKNENFKKIIISLEQNLNNDKKTSLIYLENHRKLGKEISKQLRIRKNTKKQLIGVLLMIAPLAAFLAIGFYPWLVYTLKNINNLNINI